MTKQQNDSHLLSLLNDIYSEKNPWIHQPVQDKNLEELFKLNKLVKEMDHPLYKSRTNTTGNNTQSSTRTVPNREFDSELVEMIVSFEENHQQGPSSVQDRELPTLAHANDSEQVVAKSYGSLRHQYDDSILDSIDMTTIHQEKVLHGQLTETSEFVNTFQSQPKNSISKSEREKQWALYRKVLREPGIPSPNDYISDSQSFTQILESAEHAVGSSHIIKTIFDKVLSNEDSFMIDKLIREAAKIQWERASVSTARTTNTITERGRHQESKAFRELTRRRMKKVTNQLLSEREFVLISDFYKRIATGADPDILLDLVLTEAIRLIERRKSNKSKL